MFWFVTFAATNVQYKFLDHFFESNVSIHRNIRNFVVYFNFGFNWSKNVNISSNWKYQLITASISCDFFTIFIIPRKAYIEKNMQFFLTFFDFLSSTYFPSMPQKWYSANQHDFANLVKNRRKNWFQIWEPNKASEYEQIFIAKRSNISPRCQNSNFKFIQILSVC